MSKCIFLFSSHHLSVVPKSIRAYFLQRTCDEALPLGASLSHDAFFECTATIDYVVHGSAWYYIACSGCHAKATKGPTSMVCTNTKCEKVNTTSVAQYVLSSEYLITLSLVFASAHYICDVCF